MPRVAWVVAAVAWVVVRAAVAWGVADKVVAAWVAAARVAVARVVVARVVVVVDWAAPRARLVS